MEKRSEARELTDIFDIVEFPDAYKVSYLANAIVVPTYEDVRRDFGLVRAEYHLLLGLAHFPELTAQDIARMTRRPRNSISRAVHRMLDMGFIERVVDPKNRRQAKLSITQAGREMHTSISAYLVEREAEVLGVLSPAERKGFQRVLKKLSLHAAKLSR